MSSIVFDSPRSDLQYYPCLMRYSGVFLWCRKCPEIKFNKYNVMSPNKYYITHVPSHHIVCWSSDYWTDYTRCTVNWSALAYMTSSRINFDDVVILQWQLFLYYKTWAECISINHTYYIISCMIVPVTMQWSSIMCAVDISQYSRLSNLWAVLTAETILFSTSRLFNHQDISMQWIWNKWHWLKGRGLNEHTIIIGVDTHRNTICRLSSWFVNHWWVVN
jgi:hypothetical protein